MQYIDNTKGYLYSPLHNYLMEQFAKEVNQSNYNTVIEELKSEMIPLSTPEEVALELDFFLKELNDKTPSIRHDEYIPALIARIKLAELGFDSLY